MSLSFADRIYLSGCGSTRGLHRLLHGDVVGAFEFNPLFVLSLPFLLFAFVRYSNAVMRGQSLKSNQLNAKAYLGVVCSHSVLWIFRNTPFIRSFHERSVESTQKQTGGLQMRLVFAFLLTMTIAAESVFSATQTRN